MKPQADGDTAAVPSSGEPIGLVLAGGGARGAYEAGALSVLLPALEARGERVSVFVGTSVGALNAVWLASNAHRPAAQLVEAHEKLWLEIRWEDVLAGMWSPRTVAPVLRYLAGVVAPRVRVESLLNSSPLAATVGRKLDLGQLTRNVASGRLHAAAVVATSAATGRSVVFHAGGGRPRRDDFRGIDYAGVSLSAEHVLASAAIPGAFRPVQVSTPADARGWYVDGGTRLNTPIKPALKLGATRVIVVGLNGMRTRATAATAGCPDVAEGVGHLTQAVLADPLAHDVRTLAMINGIARHHDDGRHRVVPYILIAPEVRDRIGELACEVFTERYASVRALRHSVAALGHLARAQDGRANGELLSYLFFAPEFAEALLAEGAKDAQAWLRSRQDDGIWQHGPLKAGPLRTMRRPRVPEA
jgi:NTE family protein